MVSKEEIQSYNLKEKNILVAGGTGLIGTILTKKLVRLGINVLSTFFQRNCLF